jgi:hypothetical protein
MDGWMDGKALTSACLHAQTHAHTHAHAHARTHTHAHTRTLTQTHMHTAVATHAPAHTNARTRARSYACRARAGARWSSTRRSSPKRSTYRWCAALGATPGTRRVLTCLLERQVLWCCATARSTRARTQACTHARRHARTHARTQACTHARTHERTRLRVQVNAHRAFAPPEGAWPSPRVVHVQVPLALRTLGGVQHTLQMAEPCVKVPHTPAQRATRSGQRSARLVRHAPHLGRGGGVPRAIAPGGYCARAQRLACRCLCTFRRPYAIQAAYASG